MPSSPGAEVPPAQELFASVHYIITSSLPVQRADQLRHVLDINGAVYLEKGWLDPTLNTIITNSNRFEGWEDVMGREGVHVVSDKWVERSVLLGKMQPAQYFSSDPAMIFSGIVACASDLPSTDLEVLSAGITALGGQWRTGLTRDVTHLFALTCDSIKYATAMHYRKETGIRVVLPHWFDDAVRLGMRNLPTKPYEWPDPELLKGADVISEKGTVKTKGKTTLEQNDVKRNMYATAAIFTPTLGRSSPPTESDISLVLSKVPGPNNGPSGLNLKQIQVWKGRKIILSRTLELYTGRREAVQAGIERAGGVVLRFEGDEDEPEPFTEQQRQGGEALHKERIRRRSEAQRVADCDVLVTRWRHGRAYVAACQGGKTVGTLAWLFHVQSSGVLSNPQDQLLHYPVPKRNIEAFSKHVITVTNYTGEAREYIKKLIAAMGATFTPSMSGENTALIAAYLGGTKAEKAQSWSIPIVNHTWLEDCFVQWRNLTMALEKYIVFPPGVDFSSLLGERGVGVGKQLLNEVEELAAMVFEEDEDYLSDDHGKNGAVVDNHVDIDMPNGTEGSAKEVARGLVGTDEPLAVVPVSKSKAQSKKSTERLDTFNPPEGMDVDFEPPSTAAIVANHMDWNVDVDSDEDHNARRDSPDDDDDDDELGKLKESAKVSVRAASAKSGTQRAHKTRQGNQDGDVEDKKVDTRKKTKARTVTLQEDNDGPVIDSKKIVKARSKVGKQPEEVIESDSEGELPKKQQAKGRNMIISDEEEEEEEEDIVEDKHSKTLKAKPVSTSHTHPGKTLSRVKVKATSMPPLPDSDSDEPPAKKSRKRIAVSSDISSKPKTGAKTDDHETEDDPEPTAEAKPKASLRRKMTVEVVMKSPFKGKGKEVQRSDDDIDRMQGSKKVKSTSVYVTPGANNTAGGLKAKGDARTRIKRKLIAREGSISVESEEEDSPVQPKTKKRLQNGKEEQTEERDPSKAKMQPSTSKHGSKTKAPVRSKPLRVYSSEDVESEDDETSTKVSDADAEELDSDEGLPESIIKPSGSRPKTRGTIRISAKATTSTRRESDTRNNKEQASVVRSSRKQRNRSAATPKGTISVLSHSLAMSGGANRKGKKTDDGADNLGVVNQPRKPKSKVQILVSDNESEDDEDGNEVNAIISPRTQSELTKSNSFKTTVGQSSLKGVINSDLKSKEQEKKQRRLHSNPGPRKASKAERATVQPMEVDDDHSSQSSTAPASVPSVAVPRRNAAAKASQRLHETLMPDLVNYEAQMKRLKAKSRQAAGNLSAFALEFEGERERDVGKRKKIEHVEGGSGSDREVQPKKKRRVTGEGENTIKVKGKQKAKEDSPEVEGSRPSSGVVLLTTQVTLPDDVLKSLTRLGVRMTTRPNECTHLLCPHLVRTEKFLCALAHAPFILSAKWATASAAAKKLLPEKEFILKDPAGEKKFEVNLAQALRRAKANKGKLLEGKMFYLTPKVSVDKKLLKNVVNACGGDVTTQSPSLRIIRAAPEKRYVISCKEDISIWRPIAIEGYKIFSQELLLAGIMNQQIEWDREEFMVEP